MSKDLEYFKDFLENPESFNIPRFYKILHEWAEYIKTHKDEFDYAKDENWREIRERLAEAFRKKEEIKAEFDKLTIIFEESANTDDDDEKLAAYKGLLDFMKRNQHEYGFSDDVIDLNDMMLNQLISSIEAYKIAEANEKESEVKVLQALEKLDNAMFENYERTGKRPVLTALKNKKDTKGN